MAIKELIKQRGKAVLGQLLREPLSVPDAEVNSVGGRECWYRRAINNLLQSHKLSVDEALGVVEKVGGRNSKDIQSILKEMLPEHKKSR